MVELSTMESVLRWFCLSCSTHVLHDSDNFGVYLELNPNLGYSFLRILKWQFYTFNFGMQVTKWVRDIVAGFSII